MALFREMLEVDNCLCETKAVKDGSKLPVCKGKSGRKNLDTKINYFQGIDIRKAYEKKGNNEEVISPMEDILN